MTTLTDALFTSQPQEHAFKATDVEGEIPADLQGTFLRTGAGLMHVGDDLLNFFDGHALVAGLSFQGGTCVFRSRFVRTPVFEEESTAQAMTRRRVFTNLPSRWANLFNLRFGNNAMHDVYAWGDRVVAANDPGHFALDAATLATRGPETWGGLAAKGLEMSPMPNRDPTSGRLVGWLKTKGQTKPDTLSFVELDANFEVVHQTPFHRLDTSPAIIHEHRSTEHHHVTFQQGMRLSPLRAIWGASTLWESLQFGKPATLLVAPRHGPGPMVRIDLPLPLQIVFHVLNAFEDGPNLVVDAVTYDGPIHFSAAAPEPLRRRLGIEITHGPQPTPMRFVVDPKAHTLVSSHRLGTLPAEAPRIREDRLGLPYRYAYLATPGQGTPEDRGGYFLYSGVAKLDVTTGESDVWSAGPTCAASPPVFVPRPDGSEEDDGWLLTWVLETAGTAPRASVVILDARSLDKGPLARVQLGMALPAVSHTRWAQGLVLADV